ncbi:MAG: exodeoxyribonuclease VII small subunit [Planctomycetota bacterium]
MPKAARKPKSTGEPAPELPDASFEQDLSEVEKIAGALEDGRLDLAESLTRFEEGVARLKRCYSTLDDAEKRISVVAAWRPDGSPETEPFETDDEA